MAQHHTPSFHLLSPPPMTEFEAEKCSVRNVFWDEDEYLVA